MSELLLRNVTLDELRPRGRRPVDDATLAAARSILDDIDARGGPAVLEHAARLGDVPLGGTHLYRPKALAAALERLPTAKRGLLERAANRIGSFARAQRGCMNDLNIAIFGGEAGHECLPVRAAGCYAPGGRFPLPSSVLMTAVTARAAGVAEVWVASPHPTDETLAAAAIAGADGLLGIGGVQAVAAMARGLVGVPACDMIVGPGNRWVTAAKQLVSGEVGIDMLAGPSELVVLADHTADAGLIAADLLAQAEHDEDAVPILVTTSASLAAGVELELGSQLRSLPTAATARAALHNGYMIVTETILDALLACDRIAPEHLEIMTADAEAVSRRVRNAGGVFIGARSAEVLGDYGAGPNHVLPTGASSRYRAGLSVFTFLRARTWMRIDDPEGSQGLAKDAAAFARMEGLEGHARSAEARRSAGPA